MHLTITKAGVIGAGTMGAGIAAHLANCGIKVLLLDIVPSELTEEDKAKGLDFKSLQVRNRITTNAVAAMLEARATPLYDTANAKLITPGNIEDDFDKLADVDWIIEAAPESLKLKRSTFKQIEAIHRKGQVISSNTSGISLEEITKGCKSEFLSDVMICHFFNPPRYMHLMELIPCKETDEELFGAMTDFSERVLGKGVVIAKDTSNFIANRIGFFDANEGLALGQELKLTVEQVDAIIGPLTGRPKSGLFRLLDIIGIDISVNINSNLYQALAQDKKRDIFKENPLLTKMLEKGLLGNKTGCGFYKKSKDAAGKRVIEVLDLETLKYNPAAKVDLPILLEAKKAGDVGARIRALFQSDDVVGRFAWGLWSKMLCYVADRVPEISDSIIGIDNAMKWGYNWQKGPFELWDAIGVEYVANRFKQEGREVPALVQLLLETGKTSFYGFSNDGPVYFDASSQSLQPAPKRARVINLEHLKKANKVIKQGKTASIIDLGDGILCLEFCSKANAINSEVIEFIDAAVDKVQSDHRGLVVGNQGSNFCLGADLKEMSSLSKDGIESFIANFQDALMKLKYCHIPVVGAVHGMCLGGGTEVAMSCDRRLFAPETYIGLVEVGVGLLPAAGGCKRWTVCCSDWIEGVSGANAFYKVNTGMETICQCKKSANAVDARKLGYLTECDEIVANADSLIYGAKQRAIQLSEQGYRPPLKRDDIAVLGRDGIAEFKVRMNMFRQGNFISEYEEYLMNKVAYVVCGGDVPAGSKVSEQYLLDLEREVFVELIGQAKTRERIAHTLKTGKPLRN
ncbi:MAG: 3-hydroxyacyl-CoA dehydrogenase/enoyl-CoA hydratase family protein [Planctomycetota bacterium]|jgi:3-hydroxyacyl-CoA dehydrogenase